MPGWWLWSCALAAPVVAASVVSPLFVPAPPALAPDAGLVRIVVGDIDGDGVDDAAVASPRDAITSDRVGRVRVISGAGGRTLQTFAGRRGERFGLSLAEADADGDGQIDLVVGGMALDHRGVPKNTWTILDPRTRRTIDRWSEAIPGATPAVRLPGQREHDEIEVLQRAVTAIAQGRYERGLDLDGDGRLTWEDADAAAAPEAIPPADEADVARMREIMAPWTLAYPEDAISRALMGAGGARDQGAPDWWVERGGGAGGRAAPSGDLVNTWQMCWALCDIDGDGDTSFPPQGETCDETCGCGEAQVTILDCPPDVITSDAEVTLNAEWSDACDERYWEVRRGWGWERHDAGTSLTIRPWEYVQDGTHQLEVRAVCVCNGWATVYDTCTLLIEKCGVAMTQCASVLTEGETGTLIAHGSPDGGTYTWEVVEGIAGLEANGPSCQVTPGVQDDDNFCTVRVTYTQGGCSAGSDCTIQVIPLDSDGDGVSDADEIENGTDPYDSDTDDDGVYDGDEQDDGTDGSDSDTDDDGVDDGCERKLGWDPTRPNDLEKDSDHDRLTDVIEVCGHDGVGPYNTNPDDEDTDNDQLEDGCEVSQQWDPLDAGSPTSSRTDTDGDGFRDLQELHCRPCLDHRNADTDGDGLGDYFEWRDMTLLDPCDPDVDNDGLLDGEEINNPQRSRFNYGDSDNDGMLDGWEVAQGLNAMDGRDASADRDEDGLSAREEFNHGTDPWSSDTDGDGIGDRAELEQHSDPASDRSSTPNDTVPVRITVDAPTDGDIGWTLRVGTREVSTRGPNGAAAADVELARGERHAITVEFNGGGFTGCPPHIEYTYCASVTVLNGVTHILKDASLKTDCDSVEPLLGCHSSDQQSCNDAADKTAYLHLPLLDIDVDSDNDEGFAAPSCTDNEDDIEDAPDQTGKLILSNDDDADADGVPDFADGFNFDPTDPNDDASAGDRFVPVIIEMRGDRYPGPKRFEVEYAASDPALVADTEHSKYTLPLDGSMRLWRRAAGEPRDPRPITEGGDYVPPGVYTFESLGFADEPRTLEWYLESVRASDAPGDLRLLIRTYDENGGVPMEDAVRLTSPRIDARTFFTDEGVDELVGDGVVLSDPRPEVTLTPINAAFDSSGRLIVDLEWRATDQLSELAALDAHRVQRLDFLVNGATAATINGLPHYSPGPGVYPWQGDLLEASDTIRLTLEPPTDPDDPAGPQTWGGRGVVIRAQTSENAAGNTGHDSVGISIGWNEVGSDPGPGGMQVGDDPDDTTWLAPVIRDVREFQGSSPTSMERFAFGIGALTDDAAGWLEVRQDGAAAALAAQPDDGTHFVVKPDAHGERRIFVVTARDLPAGMTHVNPENIEQVRASGEVTYRLVDRGGHEIGNARIKVITDPLAVIAEDAGNPEDVTMESLLAWFSLLHGQDGIKVLSYFQASGGKIELGDFWGDLDVNYYTETDGDVHIQIEEDIDPVTAANLLGVGLNKSLAYWPVRAEIPTDDFDALQASYAAASAAALEIGAVAGEVYIGAIGIVSEGADWALVFNDLSEGQWKSAIAFLPYVSRGMVQTGRIVLRDPLTGKIFGSFSHAQGQLLGVIAQARTFDEQYALIKANFSVNERLQLIRDNKLEFFKVKGNRPNGRMILWRANVAAPAGMIHPQAHHDFPWTFRAWFMAHGIDVNKPEYMRWVPQANHQAWTGQFEAEWERFMLAEPNVEYTVAEIVSHMNTLRGIYR